MSIETVADLRSLRGRFAGALLTPGDPGWDAARAPWHLDADQHPAAVAFPESEQDVIVIVRAASELGLRVAPQATGHNAGPLGSLDDTILVKTSAMRGVRVDGARHRARVRAGALWQDVTPRAAEHGLAGLAGSAPDVGVVGYSLGGGLSWLARRHGLQTNRITAIELVTAAGERVRADREHEPDLFWALRGGGGSFGVVTALEFDLLPVREVYAGALVWDWRHAGPVLLRYSEWTRYATDLISTAARILQLPDLPDVPAPLRGRQVFMIDGAYLGDRDDGDEALAPLRALRPELDSFATMPAAALQRLALARRPEHHGALPRLEGAFALYAGGLALDDDMALASLVHASRLASALEPWSDRRRHLNFEQHPTDAAVFYDEDTHARLRTIKAQLDPRSLIHANHSIQP